ncbi:hypothetical protein GCM10017714_31340 [Curtobacterium pusillum]|uniref:DUF222 domain-containing protein n=1 Tax=Curtobacterium pusillum TaxID=69373 RepID=A0ABX2M6Y3_9MICO|nr:hypothetical protein [Curtobacterium pusillum]NUU13233.1 hypothetical protein [Curtobacterium pusillum]
MSDVATLEGIEHALRPLALREADFAAGDAVVEQIAKLKSAIDATDARDEPWLISWLSDEHYKGAVLYAAAKTNWKLEQAGRGSLADRQMRSQILSRFNRWVEQLRVRLGEYRSGSRSAAAVAAWRDEIGRFKEDPVRNF